jgi:hypothetical protein
MIAVSSLTAPTPSGAQDKAAASIDSDTDTDTASRPETAEPSSPAVTSPKPVTLIVPKSLTDMSDNSSLKEPMIPPLNLQQPDSTVEEKTRVEDKAEVDENDDSPSVEQPKKKKSKKKKLVINARIYTYWELKHQDTPDDPLTDENEFVDNKPENKFDIRYARFKMTWRPEKWLTAVMQLGDFQELEFGFALLRDAYIHVSPFQFLEIRVGQFKKPFSRLSLRSIGKLEIIKRGEGDKLLVEDLRYGDRDLGVQFSGRIVSSVKLDYQVGVFNGSGPDISEQGNSKDVVARLSLSPVKWFDFGVNGSWKFFEEEENEDKSAWAGGADAVFKVAGFKADIESVFGLDHAFRTREPLVVDTAPLAYNLIGIFSYKRDFTGALKTAIEPVFKIEYLDPNSKVVNDYVLIYSPGFNIYLGKYFRVMIAGEILRSTTNSIVRFPEQEVLTLQLCFDI